MGPFGVHHEAGRILWGTKNLPAVLTAQSSTVVKAVVREPTSHSHVSNKNHKETLPLVFSVCMLNDAKNFEDYSC